MQIYELGYLILPSIPEGQFSDIITKLKGIIAKAGGSIFDGEEPFKIDLAYTMSKAIGTNRYVVNDAYIGWIKFDLPAEASAQAGLEHPVEVIKTELSQMDEILRFILIKAPRETTFTFAKAREALTERNHEESEETSANGSELKTVIESEQA